MLIIKSDYETTINPDLLDSITDGSDAIRLKAEGAARSEMEGYLAGRYDLALAFPEVPTYAGGITYNIGKLVEHGGGVYVAKQTTTGHAPTDAAYWAEGDALALDAAKYEKTVEYVTGTVVWEDTYSCKGVYVAVATNTGKSVVDTGYWRRLPVRDQMLMQVMIDIALYRIHTRLDPRNIPAIRMDCYDRSVKWLEQVQSGKVSPCLPPAAAPTDGGGQSVVLWGSEKKQRNGY